MGRRELTILLLAVTAILAGCRAYESGATPPRSPSTTTGGGAPSTSDTRSGDPFADARRRIDEARSLPIPTGNYRVRVERVWFSEADSSAIGAVVGYTDDHWDVQAGGAAPDAGFRVGVAKDGFYGMLDGHLRSSRDATREEAMLMMAPDYPASLFVGETRYVVPFRVGGRPYGLVVPEGQSVGTSLETICTPAGPGAVQVTLTPIFSQLGARGETVRVTEATTSVRVPLGRPFLLASHDRTTDSAATALLSRRSSSGTEQAVLILTVDGG